MKNKLIPWALSCLLLLLAGCVTREAESISYKSLAATAEAANAAMNAYGELYRAGAISPEDEKRIDGIHEDFRQRYRVALKAAKYDYAAATPELLSIFLATLIVEIEALK